MADDVTLPGTGSIVKTIEKTGAEHVQLIGLDIGSGVASAPVVAGRAAAAASLPAALSNEDLAAIQAITTKLTADPATQTTLAAILAKIIAAPATEAKQGGGLPAALGAGGGLKVDGSGTALPVSISGAVPVSDNSGSLTVDGDVTVSSPDIVVTVTPTLDTNAYAASDLLFDATEVANAVRAVGGHAVLQSVTVIDKADQKSAFTLLLANAATDFGTLNSAPDPDDTEAATVIGWVPVAASDYVDLGGASVACIRNIGLTLKAGAATTSLYIAGVNGAGAPTYAASDLVLQLGFLRS